MFALDDSLNEDKAILLLGDGLCAFEWLLRFPMSRIRYRHLPNQFLISLVPRFEHDSDRHMDLASRQAHTVVISKEE